MKFRIFLFVLYVAIQQQSESRLRELMSGILEPKNREMPMIYKTTTVFHEKANQATHELFVYGNLPVILQIVVNTGERQKLITSTNTIAKKNMTMVLNPETAKMYTPKMRMLNKNVLINIFNPIVKGLIDNYIYWTDAIAFFLKNLFTYSSA